MDWIEDLKGSVASAFNAVCESTGLCDALDQNRIENSHHVGGNLAKPDEEPTVRQRPVEALEKLGSITLSRMHRGP